MDRLSFLKNGFNILRGAVIDQTVPQNIKEKSTERKQRPPGIISYEHFLENCSSCEDCVKSCPIGVLQMEKDFDEISRPAVINPAYCLDNCPGKECISSCNDGALHNNYKDKLNLEIKLDIETCIAYLGSICRVCYDYCPKKGKAISLEGHKPVFDTNECTYCNECLDHCVGIEETIKINAI